MKILWQILAMIISLLGWIVGGLAAAALYALAIIFRNTSDTVRDIEAIGPMLMCPEGCQPFPADGWFECSKCHGNFTGWIWAPCPACGHVPGQTACLHCGHMILNPMIRRREW